MGNLNNVTECSPLLHIDQSEEICDDNYELIELPSGDRISYREHGRSNGIIVFYFGTTNMSSNACPDSNGVLNRLNVRLIIIDRPGYGKSTKSNDSPLSFAKHSFVHILSHFDEQRNDNCKYFLIGYQIGCIYVLSIAEQFASRINEISLVCPPTPYQNGPNIDNNFYCFCCAVLCGCQYQQIDVLMTDYLRFCIKKSQENESEDFKFIKKNKKFLNKMYEKDIDDRVWINEWIVLLSKDWNISFKEIETKTHLWHGTKDWMTPNSIWYQKTLQHCISHRVDGYGHFLLYAKFDQIVASMIHFDL